MELGEGVNTESMEDERFQGDVEEARSARMASDPCAPSKAEKDAHEATHLPFRIWCPACVNGRGDNPPHRRIWADPPQIPDIDLIIASYGAPARTPRSRFCY